MLCPIFLSAYYTTRLLTFLRGSVSKAHYLVYEAKYLTSEANFLTYPLANSQVSGIA